MNETAHDLAIDWIAVPGGRFAMGGGPRAEENPQHEVVVSPFRIARTQVTRAQYSAFLGATGHEAPPFWNAPEFEGERLPAVGPSWNDAQAFCRWRETRTGDAVRLPTEAEWEFSAKALRDVVYPWGDAPPEELPDYDRRWLNGPEPVDAYPSLHPWGLLGLGENVHEWCSDWFEADYYERSPERNPAGPSQGRRKASRGGSWRHAVKCSRCAARSSIPPDFRYADYGFRLAADA